MGMRTSLDRSRNRRARLLALAMITAAATSMTAPRSESQMVLADSRERTNREPEASAENRRERKTNEGRRGGPQPASTPDDAAGRSGRSPGPPAQPPAPASRADAARGPAPAVGEIPAPVPAQTSVPVPVPANDEVVEAAQARVAQMQALSETHSREMAEDAQRFQAQMRTAQTPAERTALQQEFQRTQARKTEALQQRLRELQQD